MAIFTIDFYFCLGKQRGVRCLSFVFSYFWYFFHQRLGGIMPRTNPMHCLGGIEPAQSEYVVLSASVREA